MTTFFRLLLVRPSRHAAGRLLAALALMLAVAACSDGGDGGGSGVPTPPTAAWESGVPLPAEPQVDGDPVRGRDVLLDDGFMTCGIPYKLWATRRSAAHLGRLRRPADAPRIPGRDGQERRPAVLPERVHRRPTAPRWSTPTASCATAATSTASW